MSKNRNNKKNGISPEAAVNTSAIENSGAAGSDLGGVAHLHDLKKHASSSAHNSVSTAHGQVSKIRQKKVNRAYFRAASELCPISQNIPTDEKGPVERELLEQGQKGRVLEPVIGFYVSSSNDLRLMRDLAATDFARRHPEYQSRYFLHACGMFKN